MKHAISFDEAMAVFADDGHVVLDTSRIAGGKARRKVVGRIEGRLFTLVFTMRGEAANPSLHFQAADVQLKLDVSPIARRDASELAGLIWRDDRGATPVEGRSINLVAPDGTARSTAIDDLGTFTFTGLPRGSYHLEVALGDELVATEVFQVGA